MYQKNPAISKGVDWIMVWLYAIIVISGLLCIFSVEYRSGDNLVQSLLGFKKNYSKQLFYFGACALLAIFIWLGRSSWPLRVYSLIGFLLMMLLLTRTIPSIQNQYPGMVQRFFYLGWTFWSVAISIQFLKLIRK